MKTGMSLTELATELERQQAAKQDYLVGTGALQVEPAAQGLVLQFDGGEGEAAAKGQFGINQVAHEQLAAWADIPLRYYNRMREERPALLATNVNTWLEKDAASDQPQQRMLRTLDGNVRAFMSNAYRPLDYAEMAEAVLPVLLGLDLEVLSCQVTERRLYLKAVDRRIQHDIPTGRRMGDGSHHIFDTCSPAIVLSNSEVGCGALSIETGVWTKACTNMAIFAQSSMRKYHVGGRQYLGEEAFAKLISDATRRLTDQALWATVRDVVKGSFEEAQFAARMKELGQASADEITGDPAKAVEVLAKKVGLTERERPSVLRHLAAGGDITRYGLFNAVTRSAEDASDYDRATELERIGMKVITLPRSDWQVVAAAA